MPLQAVRGGGEVSVILYHGGAPGFRVGDLIEPHETKHLDGCPVCEAGADENHLPDRVFATPVRLYAKYYASKWGNGTLYLVETVGIYSRSIPDSIETYHAGALRVVKVSEVAVELTMSERRHLYRIWGEADKAAAFAQGGSYTAEDLKMRVMLGIK